MWRLELFGGIRLIHGSRIITQFRTHKTAALLGLLAFQSDQRHRRETLMETFWGGEPISHSRLSLSVALCHLRSVLEPPGIERDAVIVSDRFSVMLSSQEVVIDTAEFASRLADATCSLDRNLRLSLLAAAVEQYRPEILCGCSEEWILPAQAKLDVLYATAVRRLSLDLAMAGEPEEAIRILRRATEVDPLNEVFHRQIVCLHAQMGNPGAAIRQFDLMAGILKSELQSEPSAADRNLIDAIRCGGVPDPGCHGYEDGLQGFAGICRERTSGRI